MCANNKQLICPRIFCIKITSICTCVCGDTLWIDLTDKFLIEYESLDAMPFADSSPAFNLEIIIYCYVNI